MKQVSFPEFRPKVLLTGACGKIGSRVIGVLEQTMDLRLTDVLPMQDSRFRPCDLRDFRQVYEVLEGIDTVIHLAIADMSGGQARQGESDPGVERGLQVNVGGTYNLLEAARQRGVKRVVYASSLTIHLGNKHRPRYDSGTPVEPRNLYACTKLFGEQLARVYWREHGLSTICLRIGQPFPIGNEEFDMLWQTNKRARSSFVEINDVAQALGCGVRTGVPFGIFNLVSASDNQRFDIDESRRIGYVPRAYLSDEGIQFFEDGNFPRPAGVVTHNPGEVS